MPKPFSVLLPIYQLTVLEHFRSTLGSLEQQTLLPAEVIVVVDGPISEELRNELRRWCAAGRKLNVDSVELEENQGLGVSLNHGLLACKHSLVARMDADDLAVPDRFACQLEFIENNPGVDVVGTWMSEFDGNSNKTLTQKKVPVSHDEIVKYSHSRNPMNHPTILFRKEAVQAAGGYQEMPFYEDYDLWVRMILKGYHFANIPKCLLQYRMDEGFYERRKGLTYIKYQYLFFFTQYKRKFLTLSEFLILVSMRSLPFVLPVSARKKIYKLLRVSTDI